MNQNRLDRLSQTLADTSLRSRRGVLAALGVAVLGALAGADLDTASAKRKTRHESKPNRGHHAKSNDPNGSARLHAAKRKKHGRKHGQRRGQEHQGGGATTPPPGGAGGGESGGGGCTSQPKSLTCYGKCGMIADNCARDVDCGQCQGPEGPDCVSPPLTTACAGLCGMITDYCRRQVDCGPCDGGCISQDLATTCAGKCGLVRDNCGRDVNCGNTCSGAETCGGGGTSNICGCTSKDRQAICAGRCGAVADNCGRQIDCGPCGCTSQPKEVTCSGRCGMETDNCGRQVDCGACLSGSCFIGGTRVRMANGADKAIELIEPGDRVLGRGGKINRVRGVLYPLLGDRPLYALNGGTAFVTASHPFLTSDGWKAVDPDAARAEVPELQIGQLTVGDVLVAVTSSESAGRNGGDRTTEELSIPLQSLEGRPADAATQLYNLDVDGDDTYVANGFVVHNKAR